MKKNVIFRIAAIVLMCTLVTACFASSTFAKYTSSTTADQSTVTVAKWDIVYDKETQNIQIAEKTPATVTFNLFDTITEMDGSMDADVVNNGTKNTKIAPGTKGQFTIAKITNDSEVTANIGVKVTEYTNTKNVPIKFYSDADMTQEITIAKDGWLIPQTNVTMGNDLAGKTVYWQWIFNGNDTTDTSIGIDARDGVNVSMSLQIVADQVD